VTDSTQPGLFETLYSTRALRRLQPDPLPEETLFQLVDAAIRAPSGQNAQDWRFIVITDLKIRAQLGEWAKDGWARYQPAFAERPETMNDLPRTRRLSLRSVEYLANHLAEAPAIVLFCGRRGRHSTPGGSTFPAVQNLLLSARALGLGASIFNLPLLHPQELTELLGIPEDNQVYCLVPVGYPLDNFGSVARKPVAKVAFRDRWGEAWSFAEQQPETGWQDKWLK
jgi:nitroreductase